MTLIMPIVPQEATILTSVRFHNSAEPRNDLERSLSRAYGTPEATVELKRKLEESSICIKRLSVNSDLDSLMDKRLALLDEQQQLSSRFLSNFRPEIKKRQNEIETQLDDLSLEIYNLLNPPRGKDPIDRLLERAEDSYRKGLELLKNGSA